MSLGGVPVVGAPLEIFAFPVGRSVAVWNRVCHCLEFGIGDLAIVCACDVVVGFFWRATRFLLVLSLRLS